jgi:hypothetical protein
VRFDGFDRFDRLIRKVSGVSLTAGQNNGRFDRWKKLMNIEHRTSNHAMAMAMAMA